MTKPLPQAVSDTEQDAYMVPALERGIRILKLFNTRTRELTGADISRALALPRASVFRLIYTLEKLGLLERSRNDPSGAHYSLGVGVLRLGFEYLASQDLAELARPVLDSLRDATGVTSHMVIRDGCDVVFVLKALGRGAVFQSIPVGTRLPVHATALGRALICHMAEADLANLFAKQVFKVYTPQTPRNLDALKEKLRIDAQQGYSLSQGGFESGISVVAAPVQTQTGDTIAVVSISVPSSRIENQKQQQYIAQVCQAALELTQRISHMPQNK